jgi:uncharacterized protein YoxC
MASGVTREEFEAHVGVVEREVEGEKLVTRHILEQARRNSDDLAAIKTRMDRFEHRFDGLERKVDGLDRKIGGVDLKVSRLARELPATIADVVRGVMKESATKGRSKRASRSAKGRKRSPS